MQEKIMKTSCAFCKDMRQWFMDYKNIPVNNTKNRKLQFGVMMIAQPTEDSKVLCSIYKGIYDAISFCPLCGTNVKYRVKQWINERKEMREEDDFLKELDATMEAFVDDGIPFVDDGQEGAVDG